MNNFINIRYKKQNGKWIRYTWPFLYFVDWCSKHPHRNGKLNLQGKIKCFPPRKYKIYSVYESV